MDLVDFFVLNTFQSREGKRQGEEEGIFSPWVFQCVFVWVKSVGLQLGYILWESQFPTIVSSVVARHWQGL